MKRYNPKEIEPKWQKKWTEDKLYAAVDFDEKRPKYVMLTEFPYPSGDGLHLGHTREYTLGDVTARYKRQTGHNVLYPMGYDAFGLPTENFAIKNKIAPQVATKNNTDNFYQQFQSLGFSFDWDRFINTTDPNYYKWTQWLFLQFYKAGLAYQAEVAINWCPKCKTGLANEEVVNGRHERCDTLVEKKTLKQWMLKITEYADRLIEGLKDVDYPSRIADQQINWIGRSKGAEVDFAVDKETVKVFTTRPDTLFGATFLVLAPEHPLVETITTDEQRAAVNTYIKAAQAKTEIERQDTSREKTGVFTGAYAINPVNNEKVPVWIADYVLTGYGTGAIMAVPAHDQRDYEFAKKFELPVVNVIARSHVDQLRPPKGTSSPQERDVAQCLVKHPEKEEYLLLKLKGWETETYSLPIGGVEQGESPEKAALRELIEETGYCSHRHVSELAPPYFATFHHQYKHVDTRAKIYTYYVELADLKQLPVSESEKSKHDIAWHDIDTLYSMLDGQGVQDAVDMHRIGKQAYAGEGVMINSGKYDGMSSQEMREKVVADLEKAGKGKERVNYRLRDWIFSRQHYWGEPIPIIHCEKDGAVAVPDDQLPVELPPVEQYEPTDTGESPLAAIPEWVNTTCPKCGGKAKRETDTMPNWAGSSWYYLRYYDPHNDKTFADKKKLEYWGMADLYLGGMEHTTLHLLYSRFWHQFFYDQGLVPTPEPYAARRGQGIILAADGSKMSKSKGNVVNPSSVIDDGYGADAVRLAIAFLAPYDQTTPWNPEGVAGTFRFLQRVWTLTHEYLSAKPDSDKSQKDVLVVAHKAIKKVSDDLHSMSFNTAIAALMEATNQLYKIKAEQGFRDRDAWQFALTSLLKLLAPFAPHITEELWHDLGEKRSVHVSEWPVHDEKYLHTDTMKIVVQVNGKVRATIEVQAQADKDEVTATALSDKNVQKFVPGEPKKTIYVPNKLVNFVV